MLLRLQKEAAVIDLEKAFNDLSEEYQGNLTKLAEMEEKLRHTEASEQSLVVQHKVTLFVMDCTDVCCAGRSGRLQNGGQRVTASGQSAGLPFTAAFVC